MLRKRKKLLTELKRTAWIVGGFDVEGQQQ